MAPSIKRLASAVAIAALSAPARAASKYVLEDTYDFTNFFDKFTFITGPDLSNGYVTYVGEGESTDDDIGFITGDNKVRVGVDFTTPQVFPTNPGRKSVRLEGIDVFNKGLFVADFAHLPQPACGAWPAL